MATKAANTAEVNENRDEAAESLIVDTMAQAVRKMVAKGKERGYVTYDELNAALPQDQVSSEQIEDTMAMLSEAGVNVVEAEETEEPAAAVDEEAPDGESRVNGNLDDEDIGRTDDPVRMYLREMGSVELLSREGEIAIAKRIEAGREMMIGGICESPLTMRAVIAWRDALNDSKILLRDIIDLDATYGAAFPSAQPVEGEEGEEPVALAEGEEPEPEVEGAEGEDEGEEASISLSAMEAELKPTVIASFDKVADIFKKLAKLHQERVDAAQSGEELPKATEKRYLKHKEEMVEAMQSIRLNNGRIEALVQQLYDLNRQLIALEGKLLRLAESDGVKRQDFLNQYFWQRAQPELVRQDQGLRWQGLADLHHQASGRGRGHPQDYRRGCGRDRPADHRVPPRVATVQRGEREASRGQEGNGRGEPASRDLDREEIHQPRPAVPGSDPGRQHRPDEGGG